jgi:hypothetical protein
LSYVSYTYPVSALLWRMPTPDEPTARLVGITVAEVAEALEAPLHQQLRRRIEDNVLVVYSLTADQRAIGVLLTRHDDSLVWRVAVARPLSATEFETWLGRIQP